LIHDVGKATDDVQCALRRCAGHPEQRLGTPHKGEGSALGYLLAEGGQTEAAIAVTLMNWGHHTGIPDWSSDTNAVIQVFKEMRRDPHRLDGLIHEIDETLGVSIRDSAAAVTIPEFITQDCKENNFTSLEVFTRMCHSALVDADFLDTARHFNATQTIQRSPVVGIDALADGFFRQYEQRYGQVPDTPINKLRRELFTSSVKVAHSGTGKIYRLPAQTGMGKTMAAAAFAVEHAHTYGKRRVIVAIPYTSITTQNAHEYRDIFADLGDQVVLEHHSNIYDENIADDTWRRLAASNWDSEFIVTTTVQLFDSLFSNKPSATRKLHRIANSVLVIDEVQALPRDKVPVILDVLRELTVHYGVTVLLSSATQPSFWRQPEWKDMKTVDIADPFIVPEAVRRVEYEVRQQEQDWEEIAQEIVGHEQVLAIVNTTEDAQRLHKLVRENCDKEDVVLHLSTRMCGQHRAVVLEQVRERLDKGLPVRLISTQVIEAGVDVDFPMVYRAAAPADSVLQSGGRCNREGHLPHLGRVVVFIPQNGRIPSLEYGQRIRQTISYFMEIPQGSTQPRGSFDDPRSMEEYYTGLDSLGRDPNGISAKVSEARGKLNFMKTAQLFHMIDDDNTVPVIVQYGSDEERREVARIMDRLRIQPTIPLTSRERRFLNRYTVSLPQYHIREGQVDYAEGVQGAGAWLWIGTYDDERGVVVAQVPKESSIW